VPQTSLRSAPVRSNRLLVIARRLRLHQWPLIPGALFAIVPYLQLRDLVDDVGLPRQRVVESLERALGFGAFPSERLQDLFYTSESLSLFDHFWLSIYASWMPAAVLLIAYLVFARRDLVSSFGVAWLAFFYLAIPVLLLLPTEPPWLTSDVVRLLELKIGETVTLDGNVVAAFPSLHVGLPSMIAIWSRAAGLRVTAWLFTVHAALTAGAVVYLGEHYVIDTLAGLLFAAIIVKLAIRYGPSLARSAIEPSAQRLDREEQAERRAA
jgi:PAP2 superfamily protein